MLGAIDEGMENTQNKLRTLHQIQKAGDLCDVTLVSADGEQFVAHAGILAAASSLLKQELAECESGNYNIVTSFSGREISALIHYAYTGDTTDPLLSSFTDMGLLCDTHGLLSHAAAILSLLHDFCHRGVFCNMSFCGNEGDTESGHAYLLAANCPTLSHHITNQSRVNLHLKLPADDTCDIQDEFVSIFYCLDSINTEYDSHLYGDVNVNNRNEPHPSCKLFECGKCGKVYKIKKDFVKHQFFHLDTKPTLYTCGKCDRVFSTYQYLVEHERSHLYIGDEQSLTARYILNTLHGMQQAGDLCDVTLVSADGEQFVAHAGILAAASSLLKQELAECELGNYNIVTSFSGREISALIHYAYTGDTTDPLLSSFTDMGLLCDTNGLLSHAVEILSLLHDFFHRGVFCNMIFCSNEGDTESGHAYLLAANCPTLSQHITNQSRVNLHLALPVPDSYDIQDDFVTIIFCLCSINREYDSQLYGDVKVEIAANQQESRSIFQCGKCSLEIIKKTAFIRHQFYHLNTKPSLYMCSSCDRVFSFRKYLKDHERSHIISPKFRCDTCGTHFESKQCLLAHNEFHNAGSFAKRPCSRRDHSPTLYTCSTCDKVFSLKNSWKQHEKLHLITAQFICDTCGKTFKKKRCWQGHQLVHSDERPFVCDICNKGFKQSATLRTHQLSHKGERNYMCDICGKAYGTQSKLDRHRFIHTELKPYACDYCDKRFNQNINLKTHQLVHTREKSHVCGVCGVSYGYKSILKKHLLSHDKT